MEIRQWCPEIQGKAEDRVLQKKNLLHCPTFDYDAVFKITRPESSFFLYLFLEMSLVVVVPVAVISVV
jgi:hypothetical protein